jgi:hypothetical protein
VAGADAERSVTLTLCPVTQREAFAFVRKHHRHHEPPRGSILIIGVEDDSAIVGVAIVGRPVARHLDDGYTAEVTRLCVLPSARNACSMLYAASWRACRAIGFRKLITYTLPEEGGASLRGAGWKCIGEAGGGSWSRKERPRVDTHPTQTKLRWEVAA